MIKDLDQLDCNMEKIDVCITVFGKPYQTIVTLKSLLKYSASKIDKIYLIEEKNQPIDYDFNLIKNELGYENFERFIPNFYLGFGFSNFDEAKKNEEYRKSLRYEYGIQSTDKKYILIIHNDVLFKGDIVTEMLKESNGYFGIGDIGQCWNCPFNTESLCDGSRLQENIDMNHDYNEVIKIVEKHNTTRIANHGKKYIDKNNPFPMPECRINEWCALVNVDMYKKEVIPNGEASPIGGIFNIDIGDKWFYDMVKKGHKFKHFNIYDYCTHSFFSEVGNGHTSMFNKKMYEDDEIRAKNFLKTL